MIHLFLNGLAASAGGGLTYLRNVVPHLSRRQDVHSTVALSPQLRREFGDLPNISFLELDVPGSAARRFYWEQMRLPGLIRRSGANVLISAGNFALRKSPVPQILLSRNSLYTSADFYRDLRDRGEYGLWLDTRIKGVLAKRSIHWADCTVAPSRAFADDLQRWTGKPIIAIHHGFDPEGFFGDQTPLSVEAQQKIKAAEGAVRLLFVSHYNYYRNFETLLRAISLVRQRLAGRPVRLFLTCKLQAGENPGSYRTEAAAALVRELGIQEEVVELGAIPYRSLHHLYRACDVYVTPAYTETFAHPLVEAMASGLPIVASDLPVHREICGGAALFFDHSSPEDAATKISQLAFSPDIARRLATDGRARSLEFRWTQHVDELLSFALNLLRERPAWRR